MSMAVFYNTAFVCIDTCLTITTSSDLPTSLVQEVVVPQPAASSTIASAAVNKGILDCILHV